jgi:hypothetical protein
MEIKIKVIANASKNLVKKEADIFKVYVTTQREKGKANKQVIKLLSQYFNVGKTDLEIVKGEKNNKKIISIKKNFK